MLRDALFLLIGAMLICSAWALAANCVQRDKRVTFHIGLWLMGFIRIDVTEAVSLVKGCIYLLLATTSSCVVLLFYSAHISELFHFDLLWIPYCILAVVGEMSLTFVFVQLYIRIRGNQSLDVLAQVQRIPWMQSVLCLSGFRQVGAFIASACFEEFYFRGVLFSAGQKLNIAPWAIICIATIVFIFQQILQVQSLHQMIIIGLSCFAISLVGGLVVIASGNVIPAIVAHSSFVVFYSRQANLFR